MNPNVFQHEISIKPDGNSYFPLFVVTNLDYAKMLHLAKGVIVGFAHDEEVEMNYIETSNVLEIGELEQKAPRNLREIGKTTEITARSNHNKGKYRKSQRVKQKRARSHQIQWKSPKSQQHRVYRVRSRTKNYIKQVI